MATVSCVSKARSHRNALLPLPFKIQNQQSTIVYQSFFRSRLSLAVDGCSASRYSKETEPLYFEELKTRFLDVVTVLVSAGKQGQSNPKRVLKRLQDEVGKRASWTAREQAWHVVDTDQWTAHGETHLYRVVEKIRRT